MILVTPIARSFFNDAHQISIRLNIKHIDLIC